MPLCLARLHTVDHYRASDRLSIAILDTTPETPFQRGADGCDVREGKAFFIKSPSVQADVFDDSVFLAHCQKLRTAQIVSFVGCVLTDIIRDEERAILEKISRHVDYLVLDVSDLPVERWGFYIGTIRRITRRVGICVRDFCRMPYEVLAPWVAKAVCEVGLKGVVFIDGPVKLFSRVQDELEGHRYSGGAGRIIPVIRNMRVLDIDPLVIESRRRWCAGVCVQDGATDGRFDLWKCVYEMIGKGKGLRSMLYAFGERWVDLTLECLRLEEALHQDGNVSVHKARVEDLLTEADRKSIGTESVADLKQLAESLLAVANSRVSLNRPFSFLRAN